jgi:tetratricopeptide (TPR) repeat protein
MTRTRRLLVSAISLASAFALFHAQLAAAVVTRGDDALRAGDLEGAMRLYERAIALDPPSIVAADRLAFNLSMHHDREHAVRAIAVVTRALRNGAGDAGLLADRAFAELQLHEWRAAERDFARAGSIAHDARYEHFAARMALHAGDRRAALAYAQLALVSDPSFAPARAFIRTLR